PSVCATCARTRSPSAGWPVCARTCGWRRRWRTCAGGARGGRSWRRSARRSATRNWRTACRCGATRSLKPSLRALGPPTLAAALMLSLVLVSYARHRDEVGWFGRHQLPAFDAYVYVAAAEHPRFFTVAPWGYRVLTPSAA